MSFSRVNNPWLIIIIILQKVSSLLLLLYQEVRYEVRRMRPGNSPDSDRPTSAGLRLSSRMFRLLDVQSAAQHGRRVLPDGRQEARLQDRLRDRQDERQVFLQLLYLALYSGQSSCSFKSNTDDARLASIPQALCRHGTDNESLLP